MKIAIYGDSFADPTWNSNSYKSWPELLAESHDVTNFAEAGGSLWWSYYQLKQINKIDELVDKAHNSANVMIGLRDAIDILAQEPNIKDIKLINFLESFYQSAPITKSYTEEVHEQNFRAAVLYSFDMCNEIEALGNLYHDYLEI